MFVRTNKQSVKTRRGINSMLGAIVHDKHIEVGGVVCLIRVPVKDLDVFML